MSILIVEDNPVNAKLLENFLEKSGYQTVLARTATDALAKLPSSDDLQLIITDLSMPDMDGLQFITKLKSMPALQAIPIIVVSAQSDIGTVQKANMLECKDFLVKPVDKVKLLTRVESLLKEHCAVLDDQNHVMNNLGVGTQEYEDLISTFADQVSTTMAIVVSEQAGSGEVMSENLSRALKELAESARILGANKFSKLYLKLRAEKAMARSHCSTVLKSLQELETALKAHSPASSPSAASH